MIKKLHLVIWLMFYSYSGFAQCDEDLRINAVFSEEGAAYTLLRASISDSDISDSLIVCSAYEFKDTVVFRSLWEKLILKQDWDRLDLADGYYYGFLDLLNANGTNRAIACTIYKYHSTHNLQRVKSIQIIYCHSDSISRTFLKNDVYDGFRVFLE